MGSFDEIYLIKSHNISKVFLVIYKVSWVMGVLPVIIHFYLGFSIRKKREGKISPIVWDIRSYHLFCVNGFSMKETIIFGIFINIYIYIYSYHPFLWLEIFHERNGKENHHILLGIFRNHLFLMGFSNFCEGIVPWTKPWFFFREIPKVRETQMGSFDEIKLIKSHKTKIVMEIVWVHYNHFLNPMRL